MISQDLLAFAQYLEDKSALWPKMNPESAPMAAVIECTSILRDAAAYLAIPTQLPEMEVD